MEAIELGKRLRDARELSGINQDSAAATIGAPRTAISLIESGQRSVSTLELSKLASLYGRSPMAFFEEASQHESVRLLLRRTVDNQMGSGEKDGIMAAVDLWEEGARLETILGNSTRAAIPTYSFGTPRSKGEAVRQGEATAEDERRRLGIGFGPIADVADIIANQSIWASASDLPNETSGLFVAHRDVGLAILVNARHARGRRRFSYAHEYAHALLDRERSIDLSRSQNRDDPIEVRANAFAASFLMPRGGISALLRQIDKGGPSRLQGELFSSASDDAVPVEVRPTPGTQRLTYQDVAYIAHNFGVSYPAAVFRLQNLSHISQKESAALLAQSSFGNEYLNALGLFDDIGGEEGQNANRRELKLQLTRLTIEAYRREEISRGRVAEIARKIDLPGDVLLRLAEAARVQ